MKMARRAALTMVLVVSLFCSKILGVQHRLIWDRFWLANNTNGRKLMVELGDNIVFVCQINNTTERDGDLFENILMFSSSDHLSNCNFTGNNGDMSPLYSAACVSDGFDWTLAVVDRGLSTEPAFVAGQRYYFTSFSNGSQTSAQDNTSTGGACEREPPLQLTVSVSATATETSTTSSSSIMPASSSQLMSTPMTMTTMTTTIQRTPIPPGGSVGQEGGAGHLSSLPCIVLLVFTLICLL